jgi:hypothetical protein
MGNGTSTKKGLAVSHNINQEQGVAVATDYFWLPMETCPLGVKVQLLNLGGVAVYGTYSGPTRQGKEPWINWAPLPKRVKPLLNDVLPIEIEEAEEDEECNELLEEIHRYLGWIILAVVILYSQLPVFKGH